ncbi:circularly permutated Ras 1-like isoform X1 [Pelobates cultripes]|uniref:Circularly permutated Ras 1-like isoform X1 n=1 Tax=Pelobates cultripes TaxID=61616 RepID=A0AAD1T9N4_PELCU|nr:circularly permutated Ras 1-like isoform X1 [Pelobates cultripes]
MEFGCRYIYVAEQTLTHHAEPNIPPLCMSITPQPVPKEPLYDFTEPDLATYDNARLDGISLDFTINDNSYNQRESLIKVVQPPTTEIIQEPLPHTENTYYSFQGPTSEDLISFDIPPPIPSRKMKPALINVPDIIIPVSAPLDPEPGKTWYGNMNGEENSQPYYEAKESPPQETYDYAYQDFRNLNSTEPISENIPPPVPCRKKKPTLSNVPPTIIPISGLLAPDATKPGIIYYGPNIEENTHLYAEATSEIQKSSFSNLPPEQFYVDVLPATSEEMNKRKSPFGNPPVPELHPRPVCNNPPVPPPSPRPVCKNPPAPPPSPRPVCKNPPVPPPTPRPVSNNLPVPPPTSRPVYNIPAVPPSSSRPVCKNPAVPPLPPSAVHETTVTSIPASIEIPQLPANCNILLLNIGKLIDTSDTTMNTETPSLCRSCNACLSTLNQVQENKTWTCVFCGTENFIGETEQYNGLEGDQFFFRGQQHVEDDLLIFCIDISGSMSVTIETLYDNRHGSNDQVLYTSRMEAMKTGLIKCLNFLHSHHPKKRVALVTFSDQVKLYGDGMSEPQVLEDCELLDTDYLKSQGENQPLPRRIEETLGSLESKIENLNETGATALGPAALVCIAMASQKPGSKVIICTDGRANTDLGNLEDIAEEYVYHSSRLYYSNLAEMALQHSVVVSVVTIEGTDCRLPELGQLADKTRGKVNIVHPLKLADEFHSIVIEELNATDVKVKVYLPNSMHFLHEAHTESIMEKMIGCSTSDTILTTEFNIKPPKIQEVLRQSQLPVQVQLTFSLPDGRCGYRILSQRRPVTNDSSAALDSINLSVLQIHTAQISSHLAMEGRVDEASKVALALKALIAQVMQHENYENQGEEYDEWENCMAPVYEDLQGYAKRDSKKSNDGTHTDAPVLKTFSDEMANMMFHLKSAKKKMLQKLKPQATN